MFGIATLLVFFVVVFLIYIDKCREKHVNFPPGPPNLPIWGGYWFMLQENYKFAHLSLITLAKRYKTNILGIYLGKFPTVVTFSYDLCKEMLTREEFTGRPDTILIRERGLRELKGIFFADGLFWKEQRRFSLRHLRDYGFGRRSLDMENFVAEEVKNLIDLLNREPKKHELDVCKKKGQILMPELLYGPICNMILLPLALKRFDNCELRECMKAARRFVQSADATGGAITFTPWLRYIAPNFFGYTSVIEDFGVLHNFMSKIIDEHLKTFSDDHHRDFIDVYISEKKKTNTDLDYLQLLMVAVDYFFAAPIALGEAMNFYFTYLINNPQVQARIHQEIDKVVGAARLPTLDDRQFMPYTEASIRETTRIYPITPLGIPRTCIEDTTLGGYFIPKGTLMLPCFWSAHRDLQVWQNPEKFQPERFLDQDGNLLKKDFSIAFGAGKRLCAGETFARQNFFLIASGILQNFVLESPTGKPIELKVKPGVQLSLTDNWVVAKPR